MKAWRSVNEKTPPIRINVRLGEPLRLSRCNTCAAITLPEDVQAHQDWHVRTGTA